MKEYKLAAWPDLPSAFHRTTYRRMLSDMSHRYVTVQQLMSGSGATRMEARVFLQMLGDRGLLRERESRVADSLFGALVPLGDWFRRALQAEPPRR